MPDFTKLIQNVSNCNEVQTLPKGALVGDTFGGRSFSDNVAAALERRSDGGWSDVTDGDTRWTLICVER